MKKAVPRHNEMLDAVIEYTPFKLQPIRILELCCGSGNLTEKVVFKILKPNGKLIFADQNKGSNSFIYQRHIDKWHNQAISLDSTEKSWNLWMDHQNMHDYHATISEHFDWLKLSGFKNVEIIWKNLLWTVFYSEKL